MEKVKKDEHATPIEELPDWYRMVEASLIRMARAGIPIPGELAKELLMTLMRDLARSADYQLREDDVKQA